MPIANLIPGATVDVVADDDNIIESIFFQDKRMQKVFEVFPEVTFVDGTYKLNDRDMALYIMCVVSGNGETEVAAFWMVSKEDEETLERVVQLFKNHNPHWSKVKTILIDKDASERAVFGRQFPNADLQLCTFHVLQSFGR